MTTLTTFPLFTALPSELRLKIWQIALSEPRKVYLLCKKVMAGGDVRFAESWSSKTAPPPPLYVCQESRFEALSVYKPYFKTRTSPKHIYISFELDTICCADNMLEYLSKEETQSVQRMSLDVGDTAYFGHFNMDILISMSGLKELELNTKGGERYNWSRGGTDVETLMRDFEEAKHTDPAWECPHVRILNRNTGEELAIIKAGALGPGDD